jgi:hypothetical protein
LELHHLTPLGILHITVLVTLCEAYMEIEPHFNLWNYFFRIQLQSGSDVEAVVWGCADISIWSGLGLIHTSAFRCPTLRSGFGNNSFFEERHQCTTSHVFR